LAEDASALMSATADVAGDEIEQARRRLGAALERGRQFYDRYPSSSRRGSPGR